MTTRERPLTKSSFTQGDKAVFIRDTAVRFVEAGYSMGTTPTSPYNAYQDAEALWDLFIEALPNE